MAVGDERVHKQVILDWLNQMARDYPKMDPDGIAGCFQEEFDYWPEEAEEDRAPGYRGSDPETSRQGAFDAWPRVGTQRSDALNAIIRAGRRGLCYAEVEQQTGINGVWKRISELKQGHWIVPCGLTRDVPETGSRAEVYIATTKAIDKFRSDQ
jgi:hypothetical protein